MAFHLEFSQLGAGFGFELHAMWKQMGCYEQNVPALIGVTHL